MTFSFGLFALLGFFIGMALLEGYLKHKRTQPKPCKNGHKWHYEENEPGSGYFYLKCEDCNKTFTEIIEE
jgi:hypothetical protein